MQEPTATPLLETPAATPQAAATATPESTATSASLPAAHPSSLSQVESSIVDFWLQDLTVGVGTTARCLLVDIVPHTITAGRPDSPAGMWYSGYIDAGAEFSFTFDTPWTFSYFCEIHPGIMPATVTVMERAAGAVGSSAPAAGVEGGSPTEGYSD